MSLKVGDRAPDFRAYKQDGKILLLSEFQQKKAVVLFFYPKNFTPGCIAEACSFRDHYEDFMDCGTEVIGISTDSVSSHSRFARRYKLPYTTLSDKGGKIRKKYGVKGDLMGLLPGRETFVIDKDGVIQMRFHSMQATKHIDKALTVLKASSHEA